MAISVSFILRSASQDKPVNIYLRMRPNRQNWVIPTYCTVMSSQWDAKKQRPSLKGDNAFNEYLTEVKKKLDGIEKGVSEYITECQSEHRDIKKETVEEIVLEKGTGRTVATMSVPADMTAYLDYFIREIETGGVLTKRKERFEVNTVKNWKSFRKVFVQFRAEYESKHRCILKWKVFDKDGAQVCDDFIKFCDDMGYMTKTKNKYLVCFKALVRYASERHHLHKFTASLKNDFVKTPEIEGCAQTKVYLTDAELDALYNMPLEAGSLKDQVRDVFLVGCYTGQRVSDYTNLKPSNFTRTQSGTDVVRLVQKKTNTSVVVPILNNNLLSITEKYDYKLPHICDVIINRYIKVICKELAVTVPSLDQLIKTTPTLREIQLDENAKKEGKDAVLLRDDEGNVIKHKYDLIHTHTARRSCITNLYTSHRFTNAQMMSISGHKTESSFNLYISQGAEEIADEIAKIQKDADTQRASNEGLF